MTQRKAVDPIEDVGQTDLAQIVTALFVVTALRQGVAAVGGSDEGIEVSRVIG